jgi:glycosyltransferase involved in cell wall biosynthesis
MVLKYRFTWYSRPFATRLHNLVREGNYDAVLGITAPMALYLKDLGSANVVVDVDYADEMAYRRTVLHGRDLRDRLRAVRNLPMLQIFRRRVLANYRHLIVVSQTDAQFLRRRLPRAAVHVIPLGVEPSFIEEAMAEEAPAEEAGVLMFHGALGASHNHDAAMYVLREIFPRVSESKPNSKLWLVGPGARFRLAKLASRLNNVKLVGHVPDVRPYLRQAAVCICPHDTGAGMKTKILEAWATGKAVVASPVAVEGLPARDGSHVLLADSPAAYARAVSRLLEDEELRRTIGRQARQLVRQYFLPEVLSAQLESLLVRISPLRSTTAEVLG